LRALDEGVCTWFSTSAKLTVLRGVVRGAALRLMAARVMSCSWRLERVGAVREEPVLEFRGVKKRVKRFGVMGGGRFTLRLKLPVAAEGGDEENRSGVGPWRIWRGAHGEDMAEVCMEQHQWHCFQMMGAAVDMGRMDGLYGMARGWSLGALARVKCWARAGVLTVLGFAPATDVGPTFFSNCSNSWHERRCNTSHSRRTPWAQ
jgi:hypothetical protein